MYEGLPCTRGLTQILSNNLRKETETQRYRGVAWMVEGGFELRLIHSRAQALPRMQYCSRCRREVIFKTEHQRSLRFDPLSLPWRHQLALRVDISEDRSLQYSALHKWFFWNLETLLQFYDSESVLFKQLQVIGIFVWCSGAARKGSILPLPLGSANICWYI